jgi:hypothetical protein
MLILAKWPDLKAVSDGPISILPPIMEPVRGESLHFAYEAWRELAFKRMVGGSGGWITLYLRLPLTESFTKT